MIFINTELILNHLLKVKQIGAEHWVALCPCHDDHRPSLDVAVKNNKILMACPVCGADGVRVMETLGLGTRELFGEQSQYPNQSIQKRDRPASVDYLYNDRLKKTRYYTWDDKKQAWRKCFCWYHNEGGEWQKGKGAETPPLYKTANIAWARDRHRTLYIAEGEKDVRLTEPAGAGWKASGTSVTTTCSRAATWLFLPTTTSQGANLPDMWQIK